MKNNGVLNGWFLDIFWGRQQFSWQLDVGGEKEEESNDFQDIYSYKRDPVPLTRRWTGSPQWKNKFCKCHAKTSLQSRLTLCNLWTARRLSVCWILQARTQMGCHAPPPGDLLIRIEPASLTSGGRWVLTIVPLETDFMVRVERSRLVLGHLWWI